MFNFLLGSLTNGSPCLAHRFGEGRFVGDEEGPTLSRCAIEHVEARRSREAGKHRHDAGDRLPLNIIEKDLKFLKAHPLAELCASQFRVSSR